jgi:nucleoside-diphosphate-sugar epimerase
MTKLALSNPTIPLDSLILVTGANGLIASWAVENLLQAGYRVRGTVRSISRSSWMVPFFEKRHGQGRFELVEVSDFGAPGAWDAPVKGVAGIAGVAGGAGMNLGDIDAALELEFPFVRGLLVAAKDEPSVKSVVFTSSAWAAWTPDPSKKITLHEWSYNEDAVHSIRTEGIKEGDAFTSYMAFKTLLEKRIWDWVRAEKSAYAFNTILPETVLGGTLSPENQGITSTCVFVKYLRDGVNLNTVTGVRPQRFVDTKDLGWLYVATLITPGVNGERIWGFGERFSYQRVAEILRELEPEKKIPILPDDGWDQTEVPNQRSEGLLQGVTGHGWAKLEDSISDYLESILKAKN